VLNTASPTVDSNAEHATLHSVAVVTPTEQEVVVVELDDSLESPDVLGPSDLVGSLDSFGCLDLLGSLSSSSSSPESTLGGLLHGWKMGKGMQEISMCGRPGKSPHLTLGHGGRPKIAMFPPHAAQQFTGTIVDELSPALLVVSHELLVAPVSVINTVEKLSGTVVIVVVGASESESVDIEDVEDSEPVHDPGDVLLATVAVGLGEAGFDSVHDSETMGEFDDGLLASVAKELSEVDTAVPLGSFVFEGQIESRTLKAGSSDELLEAAVAELSDAGVESVNDPELIDDTSEEPLGVAVVELGKAESSDELLEAAVAELGASATIVLEGFDMLTDVIEVVASIDSEGAEVGAEPDWIDPVPDLMVVSELPCITEVTPDVLDTLVNG
jgi:hypothetical protein